MRKHKPDALTAFWLASAEANTAMWVTLAHRVPMLLTGQASQAEAVMMVSEKVEAGLAAGQAAIRAAMRHKKPVLDPLAAAEVAIGIVHAAARPFHSRVGANAKRLSGKRT